MKRLRVLHILHSFGIGGLEKGIATLVGHASPDFEHIIMCLGRSGESSALLPPGTRIVELDKPEGNSCRFLWRLARAIRNEHPDIVHTRNWGGMDGIIAARLAGCRKIVHGEHGWGMEDPHGQSRKRILIRRTLSHAVAEFTCVSLQIKEWLETTVKVRRPVNQIYNGVEFNRYPERDGGGALRRELGLAPTTRLIGVVSRLDPIKDHAGLMEAFIRVRGQFPECHLVVIGDGPELPRLTALHAEAVHFLGLRRDVPELLRDLDVFALASLNEGIPNTVLEAMACGLPVVATAVGGTPELIRDGANGYLVAPRDYAVMAERLSLYLGDDVLRLTHGRRNRDIIHASFSTGSMVKGYEEVWRRVAHG